MSGLLLSDKGILEALKDGSLKISEFEQETNNWKCRDGAIQASSLDLSVGRLFEPPKMKFDLQSLDHCEPNPQTGIKLEPGHSVVIETHERIALGRNISGFCFPPARLARNALLMTNPGHVDPGYEGKLTFTVINLGRETYYLQRGSAVATLLLFQFEEGDVEASYSERRGDEEILDERSEAKRKSEARLLNYLSPDFGDLSGRIFRTVRREMSKSKFWVPVVSTVLSSVFAVVVIFFGLIFMDVTQLVSQTQLQTATTLVLETIDVRLNNLDHSNLAKASEDVPEITISSEIDALRELVNQLQSEVSRLNE